MQGTKSSMSSWLDLCSNGDCNIPPSGLEFHNTQLLPDNASQQSATVNPATNPQQFSRETVEQQPLVTQNRTTQQTLLVVIFEVNILYVVDNYNYRVQVFDQTFIQFWLIQDSFMIHIILPWTAVTKCM